MSHSILVRFVTGRAYRLSTTLVRQFSFPVAKFGELLSEIYYNRSLQWLKVGSVNFVVSGQWWQQGCLRDAGRTWSTCEPHDCFLRRSICYPRGTFINNVFPSSLRVFSSSGTLIIIECTDTSFKLSRVNASRFVGRRWLLSLWLP